jgi:hypothetical protein
MEKLTMLLTVGTCFAAVSAMQVDDDLTLTRREVKGRLLPRGLSGPAGGLVSSDEFRFQPSRLTQRSCTLDKRALSHLRPRRPFATNLTTTSMVRQASQWLHTPELRVIQVTPRNYTWQLQCM